MIGADTVIVKNQQGRDNIARVEDSVFGGTGWSRSGEMSEEEEV